MKNEREDKTKKLKKNLIKQISIFGAIGLYAGMICGHAQLMLGDGATIFDGVSAAMDAMSTDSIHTLFALWPTAPGTVMLGMLLALIGIVPALDKYSREIGTIDDAYGGAKFETNLSEYNREFLYNPKIALSVLRKKEKGNVIQLDAKNDKEEHKKVLKHNLTVSKKDAKLEKQLQNTKLTEKQIKAIHAKFSKTYLAVEACRRDAQIYAQGVSLSLDGKWSARNTNAIVFGASGAGKSRFFLSPNLLQANSCYIITDPSGDIMQDMGGFLKKEGYIIKCLNTKDMTKSCRFNPLAYLRSTADIPVIVNTLLINTKGEGNKSGGGDPFWDNATSSLYCAIIGYLYEVCPPEQRNFANVLDILNMADYSEEKPDEADNNFDLLFKKLEEQNPNSYAVLNYNMFKKAPAKTALSVLISAGVVLSRYVGVTEFKNLTYKDELELDRMGDEKYALFLNIPQDDTTFAWYTAMLYSILFQQLYRKGDERMEKEGLKSPELKIPVRFLIDECANVGKIPNLEKILATCRKYRLSVVPIFQNYSQLAQVYGKELANNILSNCDTFVFLGGADSDTLKIVAESLGKETVTLINNGLSTGRGMSQSYNRQQTGRELMTKDEISQMSNAMCLVLIRALKPFIAHKYKLEEHPNYRYTGEANKDYLYRNPFTLTYDDAEMEAVRVKAPGEEGYIEPVAVDSARRRAMMGQLSAQYQKYKPIADQYNAWYNGLSDDQKQKKISYKQAASAVGVTEDLLKQVLSFDFAAAERAMQKQQKNPKQDKNEQPQETAENVLDRAPSDETKTITDKDGGAPEPVVSAEIIRAIDVSQADIVGAYTPAYEFDDGDFDTSAYDTANNINDDTFSIEETGSEMENEEEEKPVSTLDEEETEMNDHMLDDMF